MQCLYVLYTTLKTNYMRFVVLFFTLFSFYSYVQTQQQQWNNPKVMSINYDKSQILSSVAVSKEGVIKIDSLPELIMITIPADGLQKVDVQFNKDGENVFKLTSSCKDAKCEAFTFADLENGVL